MHPTTRWAGAAGLVGLALLAGPAPALAQFMPTNPYTRFNPGAAPTAPSAPAGVAVLAVNPSLGANPYFTSAALANGPAGGFPGYPYAGYYYNPYAYGDPYGGSLRGAADVINSQANFMMARRQTEIIREKARQERLTTQRRIFDEWLYERANTPSPEQLRREFQQEQIQRSLNNPPRSEIYSAKSLNDLLDAIQRMPTPKRIPEVPVREDLLKRINVSKDGLNGGGNVGLLRDEGKLTWPSALRNLEPADDIQKLREQIDADAQQAYRQALNGTVDSGILKDMTEQSRKLNERLTKVVRETDFADYSEAKRFLKNLDDAVAGLQHPDAGKLLAPQGIVKGKTVDEVVKNMADKGLRFGPAVPGDEAAYQALHTGLVNYYTAAQSAAP